MIPRTHIIIFAKAPLPGFAKTRLIPFLGEEQTAKLARALLFHAIDQALQANPDSVELCVTPDVSASCWQTLSLPDALTMTGQGEGDLGQRMARACKRALNTHSRVLLMGTDCPALSADILKQAATMLTDHEACLLPVSDGGYALLGLSQFEPSLFEAIPWSTPQVTRLTRERCQALNWRIAELDELHDIDEPKDLVYLPDTFNWVKQEAVNAK